MAYARCSPCLPKEPSDSETLIILGVIVKWMRGSRAACKKNMIRRVGFEVAVGYVKRRGEDF